MLKRKLSVETSFSVFRFSTATKSTHELGRVLKGEVDRLFCKINIPREYLYQEKSTHTITAGKKKNTLSFNEPKNIPRKNS